MNMHAFHLKKQVQKFLYVQQYSLQKVRVYTTIDGILLDCIWCL